MIPHMGPSDDIIFRKIFVGGLSFKTTDETLRQHFEVYGPIEEAVVITDRNTHKSRGYGFVTMRYVQDAMMVIQEPNPCIDGRKANVNLAILGAKDRENPAKNLFGFPLFGLPFLPQAGNSIFPNLTIPQQLLFPNSQIMPTAQMEPYRILQTVQLQNQMANQGLPLNGQVLNPLVNTTLNNPFNSTTLPLNQLAQQSVPFPPQGQNGGSFNDVLSQVALQQTQTSQPLVQRPIQTQISSPAQLMAGDPLARVSNGVGLGSGLPNIPWNTMFQSGVNGVPNGSFDHPQHLNQQQHQLPQSFMSDHPMMYEQNGVNGVNNSATNSNANDMTNSGVPGNMNGNRPPPPPPPPPGPSHL